MGLRQKNTQAEEKRWQASIWSGSSPETLTRSLIYGNTLAQLRAAACDWLYEHQPECFGNASPSEQKESGLFVVPSKLAAFYMASLGPDESLPETFSPQLEIQKRAKHTRSHKRGKSGKSLGSIAPFSEADDYFAPAQSLHSIHAWEEIQEEEDAPADAQEAQNAPRHSIRTYVCRIAVDEEMGEIRHYFEKTYDAVAYFLAHDLLPETGPNFFEVMYESDQFEKIPLHQAKTVKIIDDEKIANNMLQRGGWSLLKILGKLAPARSSHTVLFILGHPEAEAV